MIVRDAIFKECLKQNDLIALERRSLPIPRVDGFLKHAVAGTSIGKRFTNNAYVIILNLTCCKSH